MQQYFHVQSPELLAMRILWETAEQTWWRSFTLIVAVLSVVDL